MEATLGRHTDIGRDSIASETTTVLPTVFCTIIAIEDSWKANLPWKCERYMGWFCAYALPSTNSSEWRSQVPGTATYRLDQGGRTALTPGTQVPNRHLFLFRRNTGRCTFVARPQGCPLEVTCVPTCPLWIAGNASWSRIVPPTSTEAFGTGTSPRPCVAKGINGVAFVVKRKHKISERLRLGSQQQLTHYSAPFHPLVFGFSLLKKDSTSAHPALTQRSMTKVIQGSAFLITCLLPTDPEYPHNQGYTDGSNLDLNIRSHLVHAKGEVRNWYNLSR